MSEPLSTAGEASWPREARSSLRRQACSLRKRRSCCWKESAFLRKPRCSLPQDRSAFQQASLLVQRRSFFPVRTAFFAAAGSSFVRPTILVPPDKIVPRRASIVPPRRSIVLRSRSILSPLTNRVAHFSTRLLPVPRKLACWPTPRGGSVSARCRADACQRTTAGRSGRRYGLARFAGEAAAEVVEGVFECTGGDVVYLGVLIDQQGGGVGFAAGRRTRCH